jgi:hypothetical protein
MLFIEIYTIPRNMERPFEPHFYIDNRNGPGRIEIMTLTVSPSDVYSVVDRDRNNYTISLEERSTRFLPNDIILIGDSRYRFKVLRRSDETTTYYEIRNICTREESVANGRYFSIAPPYQSVAEEESGLSPFGFHENDPYSSDEDESYDDTPSPGFMMYPPGFMYPSPFMFPRMNLEFSKPPETFPEALEHIAKIKLDKINIEMNVKRLEDDVKRLGDEIKKLNKEKESQDIYNKWLKENHPKMYKEHENMYFKWSLTPK